ncbi:MAG: DUF1360 domain-containing protein [Candidatus Nanopelagicales bacterium]
MNPIEMIAATTRLTILVTQDEIMAPVRYRLEDAAAGKPYGSPIERASYLITCPKCVSIWAGAALLAASTQPAGRALIRVLALSQAAIIAVDALWKVSHD